MKPTLLTVSKSVQIYLPIKKSQTMNKIFTTLLLLLCAVAVNAQTITTIDQLDRTKVYAIYTEARGALESGWEPEPVYLKDSKEKKDFDEKFWTGGQFYVFPTIGGKTYLYSIGIQRFVTKPSTGNLITVTSTPQTPVTVKATSDGKFMISLGETEGKDLVNISEEYQAVIGDDTPGEGNQFTLTVASGQPTYYSYTANVEINGKVAQTAYGLIDTSWPKLYASSTMDLMNDYVNLEPEEVTVDGNDKTYTITGTVKPLPFTSSSSFDNATWYQMKLSNDDNKSVKYAADATAYTLGASGKTSEYLWAINAENPYKVVVYNLAAGKDKALLATAGNPTVGNGADSWVLASNYYGFVLKAAGTSNYLADDNGTLGYTTSYYGSSAAITLSEPSYDASDITVGTKWGDVANNEYAEAFTKNPSAVTYDAWAKHAAYVGSNGYVTLHIGAADGKNIGLKVDPDDNTKIYISPVAKAGDEANDGATDISQLWEVSSVAQGKVRIMNATGKYIQTAQTNTYVSTLIGDEPYDYYISWDGDNFYLHNDAATSEDDYLQYRNAGEEFLNKGSKANAQFSFSPVSTLKNAMHTVGDVSYSTLYMPFGVKLEDGFTAYTATLNGDHFDLTSLGQNVPAETAVVIEGGNNATWATFSKADGISEVEKGDLKGTVVPMTWDPEHFWSLGDGGVGAAGFYRWPTGTTLPAGRAYFDATDVSATSAKGAAFGTETTGLDKLLRDATVIPANAQRYNLAGQRVDKNYKGVVVVNGKKLLQK